MSIVIAASIYIGMCLYITGMVKDMKMRITAIDSPAYHRLHESNTWPIYVREISFHNEIIE